MKNLTDKVVMVTGGAQGLGYAMVKRFADEGSKVVIADLQEDKGETVARDVNGTFVKMDVTSPESVCSGIKACVGEHGRLDVMVNNAGIESAQTPFHESDIENWRRVIDVDLSGVFYCMKYSLEQMANQDGGVIVNTSSVAGLVGYPLIPPYTAAKAGVSNLTRQAAIEYGKNNIRVNAVAPAAVLTELVERYIERDENPEAARKMIMNHNPLPGVPTPDDVAATVAFLASDDARYISGVVLPIDGAYTAQ